MSNSFHVHQPEELYYQIQRVILNPITIIRCLTEKNMQNSIRETSKKKSIDMTSEIKDQNQKADSVCNLELFYLVHASGLFVQLEKTIKTPNRRNRCSKRALSEEKFLLL